MGEKTEVIAQGKQGILMHPFLILCVKVCQNSSVLSKQSVNISYKII